MRATDGGNLLVIRAHNDAIDVPCGQRNRYGPSDKGLPAEIHQVLSVYSFRTAPGRDDCDGSQGRDESDAIRSQEKGVGSPTSLVNR